jgi:nitrogen regulatory protein PII
MKLVVAVISPDKLETVEGILETWNVGPISVCPARSAGNRGRRRGTYRGTEFAIKSAKVRLELAVEDRLVDRVVAAIVDDGGSTESEVDVVVIPIDAYALSDPADDEWPELEREAAQRSPSHSKRGCFQ